MNKFNSKTVLFRVVSIFLVIVLLQIVFAGSLEPWAPPGATMKPLDWIESRTAISPEAIPLTISVSGSYYLLGNVTVTDPDTTAITIEATDVTIDLKGYRLVGPGKITGSGCGIATNTSRPASNITIMNGIVSNWPSNGVYLGGSNNTVANILATSNNLAGIHCGSSSSVIGCKAFINSGHGFELSDYCIVKNCIVSGSGQMGIYFGNDCTITDCTVSNCSQSGLFGYDSTLTNCTSSINGWGFSCPVSTVTNCTAKENTGIGFYAAYGNLNNCVAVENQGVGIYTSGCTIIHCTASSNGSDGFSVYGSILTNCTASENGGDGIYVTGNSRIESCNIRANSLYGIRLSGDHTYGIKNVMSDNQIAEWTNSGANSFPTTGDAANVWW